MPMIILIVVLVLLLVYAVALYNGLVSLRRQTQNALSQIDVQLKRRYDLIPNLVESVKGYMTHEQSTLEKVIAARNQALAARTVSEKAAAESQIVSALGSINALAETYPQLKANENVLALQEELRSTENKIAFARQYYNDVVTAYNTKIETFPSSIFASSGSFGPKELFVVENATEREPVVVKF